MINLFDHSFIWSFIYLITHLFDHSFILPCLLFSKSNFSYCPINLILGQISYCSSTVRFPGSTYPYDIDQKSNDYSKSFNLQSKHRKQVETYDTYNNVYNTYTSLLVDSCSTWPKRISGALHLIGIHPYISIQSTISMSLSNYNLKRLEYNFWNILRKD